MKLTRMSIKNACLWKKIFAPDLRRYVINMLELMVAEDYMIVYLNGATPRRRLPGFTWMKKCYQMIDRR